MARVLVACKRGSDGSRRDRWGHCICNECRAHSNARRASSRPVGYTKEWQQRNPGKIKAYVAKWLAANKDKRESIVRSWRQRNPDRVRAMNSRSGKKWARNNKGIRNASVRARQLAKRQRTPTWANLDQIRLFYIDAARLTATTGIHHEVDHIVPPQGANVCGLHVPCNLQVITRAANRSKRNREVLLSAS